MTARVITGCPLAEVTDDPSADPPQTPAVPLPLPPREFREAGRPEPDHGGTGEHSSDGPRSRRVHPMTNHYCVQANL